MLLETTRSWSVPGLVPRRDLTMNERTAHTRDVAESPMPGPVPQHDVIKGVYTRGAVAVEKAHMPGPVPGRDDKEWAHSQVHI